MASSATTAAANAKKAEGNTYFKARDYAKAIELYTEAVNLDPENHVFYSNRSAAYAAAGDWENAARDGNKCVSLNPDFLKGYHRAANALKHLQRYKDAVTTIERGLNKFGNNADFRKLYDELKALYADQEKKRRAGMKGAEKIKEEGNDLFKAANFPGAIEKYTEAYNACKDKTSKLALTILNNRAACYQQLSTFTKVVEDCSHVLEHDENNVKALLRRGLAMEALERYRSALADIRKVLMIDPTIRVANQAQHRLGQVVRTLKKEGRRI